MPGAGHFSRPEVVSQGSFGGCQGGYRPRWSSQTNRHQKARRDHRGWSPHIATTRNKPAKPKHPVIRIFVTSGEIGTNAMHPPGKRSIDIDIDIDIDIKKTVSIRAGGHGGPPLRGGFVSIRGITKAEPNTPQWFRYIRRDRHEQARQRDAGWNVERVCREPDISVSGGCKQVDSRRLLGRVPSSMVISNRSSPNWPVVTIGDGRPTWPHDKTNKRGRSIQPTEFSLHPARLARTRCIHPASAA